MMTMMMMMKFKFPKAMKKQLNYRRIKYNKMIILMLVIKKAK